MTGPAVPLILVVDDEPAVLGMVRSTLAVRGLACVTTDSPQEVLEIVERQDVDLLIADLNLPGISGVELLERVHVIDPDILVVLMTGAPTVDTAVRALKGHAYDYLTKPFEIVAFHDVIARALEKRRLVRENATLKDLLSLYQISQAVHAAVDEHEIVGMILESIERELDADVVELYHRPGEMGPLERWRDEAEPNPSLAGVARRFAELSVAGDRTVQVPDDEADRAENGVKSGVRCALAVPLRGPRGAFGAIVAMRIARRRAFSKGHLKTLSILAGSAASTMANARSARQGIESRTGLVEANSATIGALVAALDAREHETLAHSIRVTEYALRLATVADLSPAELVDLKFGALLHDIGKIGMPDNILLKPGPLTDDEWTIMRRHPMIGYRILRDINFLDGAARIVLYHQERYDGGGYPAGLAGTRIPLGARLFGIVDTFDSMTHDRPYRAALTYADVVAEVERGRGTQFDPALADEFLRVPENEWKAIDQTASEAGSTWDQLSLRGGFSKR